MKIGFCINMCQSPSDPAGLDVLGLVRKAGFDYVEVPMAQLLALSPDDLDRAVDAITASGLPCLSSNNLFQAGVRLTGNDVAATVVDAYIDRALALAGRLGIETFIFGSTGARNIPMAFPFEKAWAQLVDMLSRLAPKAQAAGVTVVVEHVNRLEGNIVASFREGVRLMRAAAHPAVASLIDYYHVGLGNEGLDFAELNFDRIRHAHFANILGRTLPVEGRHEQGVVDFIAMLKDRGYSHKLSCEGYTADPEREIPEAAAFLRKRI